MSYLLCRSTEIRCILFDYKNIKIDNFVIKKTKLIHLYTYISVIVDPNPYKMIKLTIKDETATGGLLQEWELPVQKEWISVRDIIAQRVKVEVENYNQKRDSASRLLIQPNPKDKTLNLFSKKKQPKRIDVEKQIYLAWAAFQQNGFFVLINNFQVESLDKEMLVNDQTIISFIKLTPLVGG